MEGKKGIVLKKEKRDSNLLVLRLGGMCVHIDRYIYMLCSLLHNLYMHIFISNITLRNFHLVRLSPPYQKENFRFWICYLTHLTIFLRVGHQSIKCNYNIQLLLNVLSIPNYGQYMQPTNNQLPCKLCKEMMYLSGGEWSVAQDAQRIWIY